MAKKNKTASISITFDFPQFVGYADYVSSTPASLFVRNDGAEPLLLDLRLESACGLTVPFEQRAEVPFESTVELSLEGVFSPVFLAENSEIAVCRLTAVALLDGKEIAKAECDVTALPFDWWEGLSGNAERLASFVRPRMRECSVILAEAGKKLRQWGGDAEAYGYAATDKDGVRRIAAAIYAAIKAYQFEKTEAFDCASPLPVADDGLLKSARANPLTLALFTASCLEAAHLHPVIAVGKTSAAAGVWLYESCFLDTVTDDCGIVRAYTSEGVNNLSFFDADDLFSDRRAAYAPAEGHFKEKLEGGEYECFVDVRRCRMGGIKPCPMRGKGVRGYEIFKEEDVSDDKAPAPLPVFRKLQLDGKQPRNKQWERRLLDLTGKNTLLNFTGKNALHLVSAGADELYAAALGRELRLRGGEERCAPFGETQSGQKKELILLEQSKGFLRVWHDGRETAETALRLMRKNREADEESGAKILFLALGFLCYISKEDGKPRYAPLVLAPADVKRAKGNDEYSVTAGQDYFVNATLLEFLKREFNLDVRGLGGNVSALKLSEIFAMVRAETAGMKNWKVVEDAYLSTFSFQRYLMWNDIRLHIEEFKKNDTVRALTEGKPQQQNFPAPADEDGGDPLDVLLPMPSDSSQYAAVALANAGASFVLHGPPGTGKSQTITNIIANALAHGKRVLFVAEKKAALDVVKKRLDAIGVGEFCLELHSNKADKGEVLKRLDETLHLAAAEDARGFEALAGELTELRSSLAAPVAALHEKRRPGFSVYQAIIGYLERKSAPDVLDVDASFYDGLTEQRLSECRSAIAAAAAAAKECGGVCNSPFANVDLTEYSLQLRDRVFCACEVLLAEIRHLRSFVSLFLEFYRQRVSALTERKIRSLTSLCKGLREGKYKEYFLVEREEDLHTFYAANKGLDEALAYYFKHFKALVETEGSKEELHSVTEGGDWKLSRAAKATVKRLSRVALHEIADADVPKFLDTLLHIEALSASVAQSPLSKPFRDRGGKLNHKKRSEWLAPLYRLDAACSSLFLDFNAESFHSTCIRAANGYTMPVLEGLEKAAESYFLALDSFFSVTHADMEKAKEDDSLDAYSAKASALIDNIDLLPNWCMYRKTAVRLASCGLNFIAEALENGRLKVENVLAGFEKNVYKNFLEMNVPSDPALSRLTVGTLEDAVEKFRLGWEEYARMTREHIRAFLISRLPKGEDGDAVNLELAAFTRLMRSNLRGVGLRGLFEEIPTLAPVLCPCMLMSPTTVAQYLQPSANLFDVVIFDEASQMSTAEAVGSIARAKAAIVVGDPRQLPPTSFFRTDSSDEDDPENEDLESVLDDCLALGMPERHLLWHYRSRHESLIAFSNAMYYDNKLCTFPSPDALQSHVKLVLVDGTYDRGFTKRNRKETEALVAEVIRRLQDPVLSRKSMGVVTFSSAQQDDIERLLAREIAKKRLEGVAYDREEPIFVKNLENVQGDERDVILFSVCYGPDSTGRVSLNFGPLNQTGGWRRLNVAVSRAREEMLVFSTMTSSMIDLRKTSSKGVAGLKAFLEFAEKGRITLAVKSETVQSGAGLGKFIAAELEGYGYECRSDVGASAFKVDVAVLDPRDKRRFILGVLSDGTNAFSVKDRNILQVQTLKRGNWNVLRISSVSYYNNPKREIKRIKEILDRLTGAEKRAGAWLSRYKKPYRAVKAEGAETAAFITGGEHDGEISARLKEIVSLEEPISRSFLKKRCLATFGIAKSGNRADACLDALIDACGFLHERTAGVTYFYKTPRALQLTRVRVEEEQPVRKGEEDFSAYEVVSLVKCALEDRVALYVDELAALACETFKVRGTEKFLLFVRTCIDYGVERGLFVRSVSDRISLA